MSPAAASPRTLLAYALQARQMTTAELVRRLDGLVSESTVRRAIQGGPNIPHRGNAQLIATEVSTTDVPLTALDIMFDCGYQPPDGTENRHERRAKDEARAFQAYRVRKQRIEQEEAAP